MPNVLTHEYHEIKTALYGELKGQPAGKYYWNDGEGWVEFTREPGGYYLAILTSGPVKLHFRWRYDDIESEAAHA